MPSSHKHTFISYILPKKYQVAYLIISTLYVQQTLIFSGLCEDKEQAKLSVNCAMASLSSVRKST